MLTANRFSRVLGHRRGTARFLGCSSVGRPCTVFAVSVWRRFSLGAAAPRRAGVAASVPVARLVCVRSGDLKTPAAVRSSQPSLLSARAAPHSRLPGAGPPHVVLCRRRWPGTRSLGRNGGAEPESRSRARARARGPAAEPGRDVRAGGPGRGWMKRADCSSGRRLLRLRLRLRLRRRGRRVAGRGSVAGVVGFWLVGWWCCCVWSCVRVFGGSVGFFGGLVLLSVWGCVCRWVRGSVGVVVWFRVAAGGSSHGGCLGVVVLGCATAATSVAGCVCLGR